MAQRPNPPAQKPVSRRRFSPTKFRRLLEERRAGGMSYVDVMYATKVRSMATIYNWLKGKSQPDVDRFFALVELLGVKDDDLLEEY
jgi:transcriptional regulator with XRE-family HTH domain